MTRIGEAVERLIREEMSSLDVRFTVLSAAAGLLPALVGNRLRTVLFRLAGLDIGHGSAIGGALKLQGEGRPASRLTIGKFCWINDGCMLDASAAISIGDHVGIGQSVAVITNTHNLGDSARRCGALTSAPVMIGDGAWVGARSTILPGVSIGHGAIVGAGSLVNRSVAPNTLVSGVPARFVRHLGP